MKNLMILSLVGILLAACSSQNTIDASGFPLEKGTTKVYSYQSYNQSPLDPTQIVKATYELTETIVDTEMISSFFIAHVQRDLKLISADPDWTQELSSQPNEFWYVRDDQRILQSNLPLDVANINPDQLILDYEFPLKIRKNWCLLPDSRTDPKGIAGCDFVGRREVTNHGRYETPAGTFENCYDLMDIYNGGNILQKFCEDVGIVFMKFDHSGSLFGFEQTLIHFTKGTP